MNDINKTGPTVDNMLTLSRRKCFHPVGWLVCLFVFLFVSKKLLKLKLMNLDETQRAVD